MILSRNYFCGGAVLLGKILNPPERYQDLWLPRAHWPLLVVIIIRALVNSIFVWFSSSGNTVDGRRVLVQVGRPVPTLHHPGPHPPQTVAVDARGSRHQRGGQLDRDQTAREIALRFHRLWSLPFQGAHTHSLKRRVRRTYIIKGSKKTGPISNTSPTGGLLARRAGWMSLVHSPDAASDIGNFFSTPYFTILPVFIPLFLLRLAHSLLLRHRLAQAALT